MWTEVYRPKILGVSLKFMVWQAKSAAGEDNIKKPAIGLDSRF